MSSIKPNSSKAKDDRYCRLIINTAFDIPQIVVQKYGRGWDEYRYGFSRASVPPRMFKKYDSDVRDKFSKMQ